MVKSKTPSTVTVALRLPESAARFAIPNNRVSDKFRNDTPLWKVLRYFEETDVGKEKHLSLTARGAAQTSNGDLSGSGQLYWEAPVLKIAGRDLGSLEDFQKTLSQLGIENGSQLIMVEFQKTDTTLQEAMQNVDKFFTEDTPKGEPLVTAESNLPTEIATSTVAETVPATPSAMHSDLGSTVGPGPTFQPEEIEEQPEASTTVPGAMDVDPIPVDSLQPVEVWSPTASSILAAANTVDHDSAYEPSIAQMKAHQDHIKGNTHNGRLKSDAELEAEVRTHDAKLAAIKVVEIRVRFPDGHVAKWSFGPDATGATLYEAVDGVLEDPGQEYKLVLPAGGGVVQNQGGEKHKLIRGYNLKGGVLVTLIVLGGTSENIRDQTFLKAGILSQAREIVVPQVPLLAEEINEEAVPPAAPEKADGSSGTKKSGIPKWLKLGKK